MWQAPAPCSGPLLCLRENHLEVTEGSVISAPPRPRDTVRGCWCVCQALLNKLQAALLSQTDLITPGVFQVQVTWSTFPGNWIAGDSRAGAQSFPDSFPDVGKGLGRGGGGGAAGLLSQESL